MNTSNMLDAIERKIQDSSYDRATMLLPMLNEALLQVAYRHPLSMLQVQSEVESVPEQEWVELPYDYDTYLYYAFNKTKNSQVRVCYTKQTLNRMFDHEPKSEGAIEAVTAEIDKLYYRRIPKDPEIIELQYYTKPEELTDDQGSVPEAIPAALHHKLLVDQVVSNIYSEIEDGADSQKANSLYHEQQFEKGMELLRKHMPDVSKPRQYYPRIARVF